MAWVRFLWDWNGSQSAAAPLAAVSGLLQNPGLPASGAAHTAVPPAGSIPTSGGMTAKGSATASLPPAASVLRTGGLLVLVAAPAPTWSAGWMPRRREERSGTTALKPLLAALEAARPVVSAGASTACPAAIATPVAAVLAAAGLRGLSDLELLLLLSEAA